MKLAVSIIPTLRNLPCCSSDLEPQFQIALRQSRIQIAPYYCNRYSVQKNNAYEIFLRICLVKYRKFVVTRVRYFARSLLSRLRQFCFCVFVAVWNFLRYSHLFFEVRWTCNLYAVTGYVYFRACTLQLRTLENPSKTLKSEILLRIISLV